MRASFFFIFHTLIRIQIGLIISFLATGLCLYNEYSYKDFIKTKAEIVSVESASVRVVNLDYYIN